MKNVVLIIVISFILNGCGNFHDEPQEIHKEYSNSNLTYEGVMANEFIKLNHNMEKLIDKLDKMEKQR